MSVQVTFYILIAFLLAYGVASAGMSRDDMLIAVLIASAVMVPIQFMFSAYSDRHGRRGIFMLGAALTAIWGFCIFPLVDTGNFLVNCFGNYRWSHLFGNDCMDLKQPFLRSYSAQR